MTIPIEKPSVKFTPKDQILAQGTRNSIEGTGVQFHLISDVLREAEGKIKEILNDRNCLITCSIDKLNFVKPITLPQLNDALVILLKEEGLKLEDLYKMSGSKTRWSHNTAVTKLGKIRAFSIYILQEIYNVKQAALSEIFGLTNRSSISSVLRVFKELMYEDPFFKKQFWEFYDRFMFILYNNQTSVIKTTKEIV